MSAAPIEPALSQSVAKLAEKRNRYDVESLLAVAVEVFGERGYDGTSMDDLARAAGITKSSFYHHVKGKEELLQRSLDRALGGLFAALDAAEAGGGPAVSRLEGLLRGSVAVLVAELPHVTLLLRVRGNTETERSALARRREFDHRVTALVGAAVAEGDLRAGADPALTARLLFGLINSLTEWYRPGGGLGEPALADAVVELALGGLRVRRH
ncbi:MAG TPA: TetR/AcrR family transcriptional regulator [Sporichthya sp.]|nr:TetR/AcrR family transcriptional regulator [Sporichthya sp.]